MTFNEWFEKTNTQVGISEYREEFEQCWKTAEESCNNKKFPSLEEIENMLCKDYEDARDDMEPIIGMAYHAIKKLIFTN